MARHKAKPANYDPMEFVKVWNTSETPEDVAKRFSMTKDQVTAKASQWRRDHGIFMKIMKKGPSTKVDWDELAQFSKKYQKNVSLSAVQ